MILVGIVMGVIGVSAWVVWAYVILRLAKLGIEHPAHKVFLIELAESKKMKMPTITLEKIGKIERKGYDDNTIEQKF